MGLPQFIMLKSSANKFLCYTKKKGKSHASSLHFSHEMPTPKRESETKTDFHFIKFEVEEAKTAKGFVHIRTCYNNKYWVRKDAENETIVAEANEAEEDQSKWSCTLFKPILLGTVDVDDSHEYNLVAPLKHGEKPQKIQLMHMSQLKQPYVDGSGHSGGLESRSSPSRASDTFTAYDVAATAVLPQNFTFIGNDGKFISNFQRNDLGFATTDVGATGVAMFPRIIIITGKSQGVTTPENIPLTVRDNDKKWYIDKQNDITLVDSVTETNTLFGPVKVGDDHIALHVTANGNYLHRWNPGSHEGTGARLSTITQESLLKVGEPVIARQILSADYSLDDARVYNTSSLDKYVDSRSNNTSVEQTGLFEVEYKSTQTTSWKQSLTVNMGIKATWSVGIPFVGEFGLDVSYDRSQTSEWGEEKVEEKTVKYTQSITIPARKKVTLKVIAVKSMCDVPFTCVVRDVMTDGKTNEYTKTDCLFTGGNEFSFKTVMDEEDV